MKREIGAVVAVASAIAVGVGVARATVPDANGVFHGCYALDGGALRVIDTGNGETCAAGTEVPLDWNLAGPAGPKGPAGPAGPGGIQGAQGAPGTDAASAAYERVTSTFSTDGNGKGSGDANCPNGKLALGGGVLVQADVHATTSRPKDDGSGWSVTMRGAPNGNYFVYAICLAAIAKGGGGS